MMTNRELAELYRLTDQAFDLRRTPYYRDALAAIEDWWERRHQRRLDQQDEDAARIVRLHPDERTPRSRVDIRFNEDGEVVHYDLRPAALPVGDEAA